MNLAEHIPAVIKRPSWHYHTLNGEPFNEVQCALYDIFADAIENRTQLVLPVNAMPRGMGKSEVMRTLSKNFGITCCDYGGLYTVRGDGVITRPRSSRPPNGSILLIDGLYDSSYTRICEERGRRVTPVGTRLSTTYSATQAEVIAREEIIEISRRFNGGTSNELNRINIDTGTEGLY